MEENNNSLTVTESAKVYLLISAKWARFMAILGLVMSGLAFVLMLVWLAAVTAIPAATAAMPAPMGGMVIGIFIFCAVAIGVSIIPTIFMLRFATKAQQAVLTDDSELLTEAFDFQKRYYVFTGVFTIVVIGLYLISIPILIGVAASTSAAGLPMQM